MKAREIAPAVLALSVLAACASAWAPGDRLFEQGDYRGAAAAYERALMEKPKGSGQDRFLFRLALSHTLADDLDSPAPVRQRLEQLLELYPRSSYAPAARALLTRTVAQERLTADLVRGHGEALARASELADLQDQLAIAHEQMAVEQEIGQQLQARITSLEAQIERTRKQLADKEAEAKRLRRELDILKSIDRAKPP